MFRNNKRVVRKWLPAFMALILCFFAAGCQSGSGAADAGEKETSKENTAASTEKESQHEEKPVIYVYGADDGQHVDVTLQTEHEITCEYPARPDGENTWYVKADRDGRLQYYSTAEEREENAQPAEAENEFNYIFWEGKSKEVEFDFSTGFCVAGRDTAYFLEQKLSEIGLNRREANEFIIYWLPRMKNNAYNIISFQTDAYTNQYRLSSTPSASMLRVFMAFKAVDQKTEIPAQDLGPISEGFSRQGLAIVEWGGAQVK